MSPAFSFPPPPPPPPKATSNATQLQSNSQSSSRGRGIRGNSRGHGRGTFQNRGQNYSQQPTTRPQNKPAQDHHPNRSAASNYLHGQQPTFDARKTGQSSTHSTKARYQDPDSPEQQPTYTPPLFHKRKYEGSYIVNTEQRLRAEKKPKVRPAPPIPMFGTPLPTFVKPSLPTSVEKTSTVESDNRPKKQKKKRETNQLGLTPAGEDHEVSDEDIDEEAMFASLGVTSGDSLYFEHDGQILTLGTPAELKAWIEQRRKHYPTQARVAERKARAKELKELKETARQKELEKTRQKVVESQRHNAQEQTYRLGPHQDAQVRKRIEKHLAKAEKLRQELLNVKKASPKANTGNADSLTLLNTESKPPDDGGSDSIDTDSQDDGGPEEIPLHDTILSNEQRDTTLVKTAEPVDAKKDDRLHNLLAQYGSDVSDRESSESSSEESSVVSSSSDSSEGESKKVNEAEQDAWQNPKQSHKSAPAQHELPRGVCHQYYLKGRCNKGRSCKFKHARSGSNDRPTKSFTEPPKRQSLYQKLVVKEKEQENRAVLQAIKLLGDNGLLDEQSQM